MDLQSLHQLDPDQIRVLVPQFLSGFIADEAASTQNSERVGALFRSRSDKELQGMLHWVSSVGADHTLYRANPLCRELLRAWSRDVIPTHGLAGTQHLAAAMNDGPTVLIGNHLSYYDTAAMDVVLAWNGHAGLADRVVALAGPKVYAHVFRRFAAASLNTLPVPQSTTLEHTAELKPRELARQARASMEAGSDAISKGYSLLIYGEGSRSRSGSMGSFLRGIHRYLRVPGTRVVPTAVWGTEALFPVEGERIVPAHVELRFGPAIDVHAAGGSKAVLDAAWQGVAELLPPPYKPADGVTAVA